MSGFLRDARIVLMVAHGFLGVYLADGAMRVMFDPDLPPGLRVWMAAFACAVAAANAYWCWRTAQLVMLQELFDRQVQGLTIHVNRSNVVTHFTVKERA